MITTNVSDVYKRQGEEGKDYSVDENGLFYLTNEQAEKKMTAHIRQRICVRTHTFQEWREGLMMV